MTDDQRPPDPQPPAPEPPEPGPESESESESEPEFADIDGIAAQALARARQAARDKGLRPGSKPRRRRRSAGSTSPAGYASGRDPALVGEQLEALLAERGWHTDVAAGAVIGRWAQIVGPAVADHAQPLTFTDGVLVVRAESSAWASQLVLLRAQLLARIADEVGPDVVADLRIVGPAAPRWIRGRRTAPGRGPRDTYG